MRMVAKFTKGEEVKYISHLDMQRLLQRAFRRSELPIAYSAGFNPHPIMSIALALPVGVVSCAEYLDSELLSDITPDEFMRKINGALPVGVRVLRAEAAEKNMSLTSLVEFAEYLIKAEGKDIESKIQETLSKNEILEQKKGKSGMREIDIRPLIVKLENREDGIYALLKSSSAETLSPQLLIKSVFGQENASILRTELYTKDMRELIDSVI